MKTIETDYVRLGKMKSDGEDFLLLFTAKWCGHCAVLKKELEASPADFALYEIDITDEASPAWDEYDVQVVPTVLCFKRGKELARKAASFTGLKVKDIKALSSAP